MSRMMMKMRINADGWIAIVSCLVSIFTVADACYFSQEFQGSYLGQYPANDGGPSTHYSEVAINVDAIPVWGMCHKKLGHNVLLRDRTRTTDCIRCFAIHLHSPNILQIHTEGLDKCYMKEEAAMATCPTDESIKKKTSKEIILYRKPGSDSALQQVLCPIGGRYKFTYVGTNDALTINNGQHQLIQRACTQPVSEFSNCPYGFAFTVKYKQCNFQDSEASFQCLGDWDGVDGERYLGLLDPRTTVHSAVHRYRCSVYRRDPLSGVITLSMSRDSTCNLPANSTSAASTSDYETFVLTPGELVVPSWPLRAKEAGCKFPNWTQGAWQMFDVQGETINYTDLRTFQRSTMKCISQPENNNGPNSERYVIYSRTQCGDETYNCITMQQRGKLVMEFQLGQYPSLQYNDSICTDQQFAKREWITQGMITSPKRSSCPISGEYTGFIPDATGLCAKLSSDCNNPAIMFYTVSNCEVTTEIYEEREYRCLGEWEEDGVLYTYTQRRDLPGFQCFVGTIVEGEDVFIKEAGDNCVRGMDPLKFGMKMTKQDSCDSVRGASAGDQPQRDQPIVPRTTPRDRSHMTTPTKPWKPITADPSEASPSSVAVLRHSWYALASVFLLLLSSGTNRL